jgi:predicted esterase
MDLLCIVLHGHGMQARQMVEWFEGDLCSALPMVGFLFLQAPTSWQVSSQEFLPSWLKYLREYDGEREDDICQEDLARATSELRAAVEHEAAAVGGLRKVVLLGLSQGGCMALELACLLPLAGVITLVSHRLRYHSHARLLCPWFALTARRDDVYSPQWATVHLLRGEARMWQSVEDDHYLQASDAETHRFLRGAFAAISAEQGSASRPAAPP